MLYNVEKDNNVGQLERDESEREVENEQENQRKRQTRAQDGDPCHHREINWWIELGRRREPDAHELG